MPWEVATDHETRTIAVTGFGTGTTAETLQLIADHHEAFRACPGYNFIYDSSQLEITSSALDMIRVAQALFGDGRAGFRRFAIVVPDSRVHLARMFTALAHPFGIDANVFGDAADARRWLGIEAE